MTEWQNWSKGVTCHPDRIERPETEASLQSVVREAAARGSTVRVAGNGHSFSSVVPTDETLVSLERFDGVVAVDSDANEVTVRAGTTLGEINEVLARHGLTMRNLGDIDCQTVAGTLATGTHGTGLDFGVISTQAVRIRLVTVNGEIREITPESDADLFRAAQVSVGALGVISTVTLEVEPRYDLCLRRRVLPLEDVLSNIDHFHEAHRQWEFFWFPYTDEAVVKTFDKLPPGEMDKTTNSTANSFSGKIRDAVSHHVETFSMEGFGRLCTRYPSAAKPVSKLHAKMLSDETVVGPSHEVFANDREVRFEESEYSVPADTLPEVFRRVRRYVHENEVPVQLPLECRYVGGDEPYLSPAYGRDSAFVAVHTHHNKQLRSYFEACESIFAEYDGRPHWGKHHSGTATELAERYPRWDDFASIRESLDPEGVFLNDHLETVLVE